MVFMNQRSSLILAHENQPVTIRRPAVPAELIFFPLLLSSVATKVTNSRNLDLYLAMIGLTFPDGVTGIGIVSSLRRMGVKHLFLMLLTSALFAGGSQAQSFQPTGTVHTFDLNGVQRSYRLHIPTSLTDRGDKHPLVMCLHGGGSDAAMMSKAGWSELADKDGFLVVYPEGLNGRWNDGRKVRKHAEQDAVTDDVDFLIQLLDHLIQEEPVDSSQVYLVGISNGGFMTQRLAVEHTGKFAAVALKIASLQESYVKGPLKFEPKAPISVLFMNGTEDPFMPYEGGKLTPNMTPRLVDSATFDFGQGSAIPTMDAVHRWVIENQLAVEEVVVKTLPDKNPNDGCQVHHHRWANEDESIVVELYKIEGGGHTIPGGTQYLPERIIGPVCHDMNGIKVTWDFFRSKRR